MDKEKLYEAFKIAMEGEEEAYELYKELSEKTNDIDLKKLFEEFANDESKHLRELKERYESMRASIR